MTKFKFMLCSLLALLWVLPLQAGNGFVIQHDGQLWRDGQPYYFVGTNFWYGVTLPSQKTRKSHVQTLAADGAMGLR